MRLELTLPALERLLGGDTEIEVHLRHQIVEEFAKKYLKTILNDETWKRVSALWRSELDAAVASKIKELSDGLHREVDARADSACKWNLREALEKSAFKAVDAAVAATVERQKTYFHRDITRAVTVAMEKDVNRLVAEVADKSVSRAIDGKIDALVEAEIQRRLTLARETK